MYHNSVRLRESLATLMAALAIAVSLASASCDLSCAFNQFPSDCDQTTRLAVPMEMPMKGMVHADGAHQSKLGQTDLATIHVSSGMGSCPHQPCDKPTTLSLQKSFPTSPQLDHAVLAVLAYLQWDDTFVSTHHTYSASPPLNLSALDPLFTSLKI
jgi:hypothetical protein